MLQRTKNIVVVFLIIGVFFLGTGIGVAFWANQQLAPVASADAQSVLFVVPKGATTTKVASLLKEKGLVRSDLVFRLYARQVGLDRELQAGSYQLSPAMSASEIVATFREGSQAIWVTLPEGLRVEEVAARIASADLPEFDPDAFIELAQQSEGRLFPDTYLVPRESTAQQLFALLTRTFQDKVELKLSQDLQTSDRSLDEIIIFASLIQRESNSPEDMRQVAGVIANRLKIGMKLDIDATLSYVRGFDPTTKSWWSAPDPALKTAESPYNTYLVAGLPPAPIANPGLEALQAALDPAPTTALFYLHTPSGQAYYADTYEEHMANIDRYLR